MLDGQYVFASDEEGTNFATDRHVARLAAAGRIQPALIVAIDNPGRDLETRVYHGAGHAFAQTAVQMDELLAWLLA